MTTYVRVILPMYMCVWMHVCVTAYMCACVCVSVYTIISVCALCLHNCIHVYLFGYMQTCRVCEFVLRERVRVFVCNWLILCMYTCICGCMYAWVSVYACALWNWLPRRSFHARYNLNVFKSGVTFSTFPHKTALPFCLHQPASMNHYLSVSRALYLVSNYLKKMKQYLLIYLFSWISLG